MAGKIGRWGNSAAVRIPRDVLERAGLREGQVVDVLARRNGRLEIRSRDEPPSYALSDLVADMDRLGPRQEPRFEDWGVLPSEWPDEDWSDVAPSDDDR